MTFSLIIDYDKNYTRFGHFYKMLDEFVSTTGSYYVNISALEENKENLEEYYLNNFQGIPQYIISFCGIGSFTSIYKYINKYSKLVIIIDDIHHGKSVRNPRIPVINNSHIVFCTYAYQFTRWGLPKINNLYWMPHSGAWTIPFNTEPINKILISGRTSVDYPDRNFAIDIAKKHPDLLEILKVNVPYHLDENILNQPNDMIYGEKFYKYLNNYICCFVDTAREYILCKVFEICASGSLLLCMNPELLNEFEQLGFIDGHNYISCTRDNFLLKVNWILEKSNLDKVNLIRTNGYKLVTKNHMYTNRLNNLLDILGYSKKLKDNNYIKYTNNKYSIEYFDYKND